MRADAAAQPRSTDPGTTMPNSSPALARVLRAAACAIAAGLAGPALLAPLTDLGAARAQQAATFIQVEAHPTLSEAEAAARRFAARVAGVNGFAASGGWYVVALGPFDAAEAERRLARLRAEGRIPGDSFVAESRGYGRQFYPAGRTALTGDARAAAAPEAPAAEAPAAEVAARPAETPREARASERLLSRAERDALQVALAWAGFYDGAIDGAFGRGTRASMAGWQSARGYEATGILTTAQRAALLGEYGAVFDGLGMRPVADREAGITVEMPTALVALAGRETPFARYEPAAADGPEGRVRVFLISQEGGRERLAGLYEIMQTLDVVPREGSRALQGDGFAIEGRGNGVLSRTFARTDGGRIKGMTLIWPEDDARADRVWQRMRASFDGSSPAVLGARDAAPAAEQSVDLVAGLAIRRPLLARSGVFVGEGGGVLTTAEVAGGACAELRLDDVHPATVAWSDGALALLTPDRPLAPPETASFRGTSPRIGEEVAVAGYPFGGALGRASLTFGRLADVRGLGGELALDRYELAAAEGDLGGPVLDAAGAVVGLLLPAPGREDVALPGGTALGMDAAALLETLDARGVAVRTAPGGAEMAPEALTALAGDMTVLVACYD